MKRIIVIIALFFPMIAFGQTLKTDDGILHWECSFNAGLNTDGYQFDFGLAYCPIQYAGLKLQLGLDGELKELGYFLSDDLETYDETYTSRLKFTTSAVLKTPRLIYWKSQDAGFYIFAEPGIILSPGAVGSKHAEYFNWDFKGGINMQIDRYIFTLGYGISDFCLYSGYPPTHWGRPDSDNYLTHSIFIGAACKF